MGWNGLYYVDFQSVVEVGLFGKILAHYCTYFYNLAKERSEVLQHLLGFLWFSVLMVCSLSYL